MLTIYCFVTVYALMCLGLICQLAADEKPAPIRIHDIKYAGLTWAKKIRNVQDKMQPTSADLLVVTDLTEIAWLFNLRGGDMPNTPVFNSSAMISRNDSVSSHRLYIDQARLTDEIRQHLSGLMLHDLVNLDADVSELSKTLRLWVSNNRLIKLLANQAIPRLLRGACFSLFARVAHIFKSTALTRRSPISLLKAIKSSAELSHIRECQLRDSAARMRHMHWFETRIRNNQNVTEKSSADMLRSIWSEDPLYRGEAFPTISAVGPSAATLHYETSEGRDLPLTVNSVYLLDAGAQYEDCTIDITRTHHFGHPTQMEKFAYTKVLQGSINLANAVFPDNVYGFDLDMLARKELWQSGLAYNHGTSHGIGFYLAVHEFPPNFGRNNDEPLREGMIMSDEPGYYETGKFGIRLETDIETVKAKTTVYFNRQAQNFSNNGQEFLKFEPLSFLPFDSTLIDECALTVKQVDYLNEYNEQINQRIKSKLSNWPDVIKFLAQKTERFRYAHSYAHCPFYHQPVLTSRATNCVQLTENLASMVFVFYIAVSVFQIIR